MEIQIPSPSVFLKRSSLTSTDLSTPVKKNTKQKTITSLTPKPTAKHNSSNTSTRKSNLENSTTQKPKQSKSRNGCITCKKKRLKCDETKPTCVQCEKRNVECEGYKKDYKWRTFEETTRNSKAAKARKASTITFDSTLETQRKPQSSSRSPISSNDQYSTWSPHLQNAFTTATQAFSGPAPPQELTALDFDLAPPDPLLPLNTGFSPGELELYSPVHHNNSEDQAQQHARMGMQQSPVSPTSPSLADLLLPGTNMREPPDPAELRPPMSPHPYGTEFVEPIINSSALNANEEDFDEEIVRQPEEMANTVWHFMSVTPPSSNTSIISPRSTDMSIIRPPQFNPSSPEMLLLRFDKQTCGILSVKDGPTENPWRTLIWPFAKTSPALYHAISSMAALHGSLSDPKLRISGMAHMNKSMKELCGGLHHMSFDQALATSLALALGEGWDEKISTGIEHLKGAKALVTRMLAEQKSLALVRQASDEETKRIRFLSNTYVYLAVIARLTSSGEHESEDFEGILKSANKPDKDDEDVNDDDDDNYIEIDPLMGCATTLFPILGKVATLIQRARNMSRNSLHLVSEADELREQLLNWQPPNVDLVEQPEDPSSEARHAVQTALAYRLASLLYLYQAVPELPCGSAHKIAKDILTVLAAVPLHSRMLIVQIFPLLVGSCEMVSPEDRHWVTQRWKSMLQRLSIVNVKSCWKLVQETWKRRDAYTHERARELAAKSSRSTTSQNVPDSPALKRKMLAEDPFDEGRLLELHEESLGVPQSNYSRPLKRRFTFDPSTENEVDEIFNRYLASSMPRRNTDVPISSIAPEYTVRGDLHWLKVMTEWGWEVFLG